MSKETEWNIKLTLPEFKDLLIILNDVENEGFYYGRKDYWDKHLKKIKEEVTKAIEYLQKQG